MQLSRGGTKPGLLPYSDKIMLSLLYPGHAREPQSIKRVTSQEERFYTMEELAVADELEITNCEQKSAYITNSDLISTEMDFLSKNYVDKQFYTKKDDMIRMEMETWKFDKVRKTKIPNLYRWIIDSGIYYRLEVEKEGRQNRGREPLVKIQKEKARLEGVSSLSGGLITLFMLCSGLMSLSFMSFIFLECRHLILKQLVKYYLKMTMAFRKCWIRVGKFKKISKIYHHQMFRKRKCYNKIHVLTIKPTN
jgi:hypothetical protein